MPPELRKAAIMRANHTFGPAGMLEQDDGENWDQSTRAARGMVGRRYPLNFRDEPRSGRDPARTIRPRTH
jgi:hypothetical protein